MRIIHHKGDKNWHQKGQNLGTFLDLGTVDGTVPCSAAMDDLVSQNIKAIKYRGEDQFCIFCNQRLIHALFALRETFRPILVAIHSVMMVPEGLEHELVIDQQANGTREALPDGFVDKLVFVEGENAREIAIKYASLGIIGINGQALRVRGVESNPEKDELAIRIFSRTLGPLQPTQ